MPGCQKRFWILQETSKKKLLESLDRMMIGKMKRRQRLNRENKLLLWVKLYWLHFSTSRSRRPRDIAQIPSDDEEEEEFSDGEISGGEEYAELHIDPADHATLDALNRGGTEPMGQDQGEEDGEPKTLADMIFSKMQGGAVSRGVEDEREPFSSCPWSRSWLCIDEGPPDPRKGLNPKVIEVYSKVGFLLSRYKSGPLPKALKILPSLPHWAQLLALTKPTEWTPHATFACTKIFVSNLKPTEVRVFLEGVLLDKCREDMRMNNGKLNVHLYEALKKGLYKPAAFFKGILFPLCEVCPMFLINILCWCISLDGLLTERSRHICVCSFQGVCSRSSFRSGPSPPCIDGLLWTQFAFHPHPPWQKVRTSLQSSGCVGVPLHQIGELAEK